MPDQADPDAVLMLRVKRGDRAAFAELVEKYRQPLFNFVFRTLRDETETEDVAQNTFLQVWKSRARYERTAKFSTWLFTIARNLCLNEIRRRSRHPAESLEETHAEHDDQPSRQYEDKKIFLPTENVLHGELAKKIEEALDELPDALRVVFVLKDLEDWSTEAIAARLDQAAATVRQRLHRARVQVQARLRAHVQGRPS